MSTVLLLVRREDEPQGLIHIALAMVGAPFNYSVVCDTPHPGMRTVSHQKGHVPTCLQCIAKLTIRYFVE